MKKWILLMKKWILLVLAIIFGLLTLCRVFRFLSILLLFGLDLELAVVGELVVVGLTTIMIYSLARDC